MSARDAVLAAVRRALDGAPGRDARAVEARLAAPAPNLVPERTRLDHAGQVELFVAMAEEASATVARVASPADVPEAVAGYLAAHNLPAAAKRAPDPALAALPWERAPTLTLSEGAAEDGDAVGVTTAAAAIAETGTLMLASGPDHPTTLDILPETHIVVVRRDQVVGAYEDAWARLRAEGRGMPRTVALVTGPSRSGDIEQTIQLGAHGPRRLHIVLVDGDDDGTQG